MSDLSSPPPDGDVNRGKVILIVGWLECALALVFLCGRLYTRVRINRSVGWDDWAMIVAYVFALTFVCIATPEVHFGTGRHVYYLNAYQRVMAVKLDWTSQAFHIMSTCFGKISIVIFILRIIGKGHKFKVWFLCTLVSGLFVISVVCVAFIFAQCTPAAALWDPNTGGTCWDPRIQQDYGYFTASYSSLSDVVLAVFPITVIMNLQMELRIKMSLAIVMGLGIFAAAASIIKTVQLKSLSARGDYTYETVDLIVWMMTEQFVIIIAACIPPMRHLFVSFFDRSGRSSRARPKISYKSSQTHSHSRKSYYPFDNNNNYNSNEDGYALKPVGGGRDALQGKDALTETIAYHATSEGKKVGSGSGSVGGGLDGEWESDEITLQSNNHPFEITKTTEVDVRYAKRHQNTETDEMV